MQDGYMSIVGEEENKDLEQWEINEKKKEYLRRYVRSKKREKRIEEEIQRLRMDKMFPSVVSDDMPHGTDQKDLSDYIVLVDQQIDLLKAERLEGIKIYADIEERIRKMQDDNEQEVLRLKYIRGMTWEEVAVEMRYTFQHTHRIHKRALKNIYFDDVIECDTNPVLSYS